MNNQKLFLLQKVIDFSSGTMFIHPHIPYIWGWKKSLLNI